jgi:hypothetical protein
MIRYASSRDSSTPGHRAGSYGTAGAVTPKCTPYTAADVPHFTGLPSSASWRNSLRYMRGLFWLISAMSRRNHTSLGLLSKRRCHTCLICISAIANGGSSKVIG